jgi:hypothetical protein
MTIITYVLVSTNAQAENESASIPQTAKIGTDHR